LAQGLQFSPPGRAQQHPGAMPKLTEQLIRKRAEHNDGVLPDLEEIALHQQELEKIENIEACCRHIRILLLQNNIIPKMEGLNKLKELEYLNLALNNIEMIEGIEGCESLKKLDLTVNFVAIESLEESVYNLKANIMLEDLYLTGNSCTDWKGCRAYVIANLPQIKQLDGQMVLPADRIKARQALPQLQEDLERAVQASFAKKAAEAGIPVSEGAYTIESRNEMYLELAAQKEEKDKNERRRMGTEDKEKREIPGVYNLRGEIRQCNEGKYDFNFDESDPSKIVFELSVPKYLETTALDCDINPLYVRCVVKDKVTQLKCPAEVKPDQAKVQRSKITGQLRIDMPLLHPGRERHNANPAAPDLQPLQPSPPPGAAKEKLSGTVSGKDLRGIYQDKKSVSGKPKKQKELIREVRTTRTAAAVDDDDDDDDIPGLDAARSEATN